MDVSMPILMVIRSRAQSLDQEKDVVSSVLQARNGELHACVGLQVHATTIRVPMCIEGEGINGCYRETRTPGDTSYYN